MSPNRLDRFGVCMGFGGVHAAMLTLLHLKHVLSAETSGYHGHFNESLSPPSVVDGSVGLLNKCPDAGSKGL